MIDDDPATERIVASLLADSYHLLVTGTSRQARIALRRESPSLIILEYQLPDGCGLELLRFIKEGFQGPVVMATASGSEAVCVAAFRLGVDDYLIKPFGESEFRNAVERLLRHTDLRAPGNGPGLRVGEASVTYSAKSSHVPPDSAADPRIERALSLLRQANMERVSAVAVASAVGLSISAFSRLFRATVGVPFRDYVIGQRLEKAVTLLHEGRYSVTDIAQMVGFGDLPRFDKVFKQRMGITPNHYRQQSQRKKRQEKGGKLLARAVDHPF